MTRSMPRLAREEGGGILENWCAGRAFSSSRLDECDAGVVVDRDMEIVKTDHPCFGASDPSCLFRGLHPPAPAIPDATELFHVHVEELARWLALIAHDRSRWTVDVAQAREPARRSTP